MNSISSLQLQSFPSRSLEEKIEIKRLGRPTPAINLTQIISSKGRSFNRIFNTSVYEKYDWLCGCDVKNALFCFPCVLFGGEEPWTKTGVTDVHHLNERVKKHEVSPAHIKNVLSFVLMGNVNIDGQPDGVYRRNVDLHNQKVASNRYLLNVVINCIKLCGAFKLALRDHNEADFPSNSGIVNGLIDFSAELDKAMKTHLDNSTVFKGAFNTIQNELLEIMLEVCQNEITNQIKAADFLAVIVDEIRSDVSNKLQLVVIYRYIHNNRPVERFWGFIVPPGHDAVNLAKCIKEELSHHLEDCPRKLIAQTYDGASIMSGSSCEVQAHVKELYTHAEYVHCYVHQLSLIMQNAASANRNVRLFFSNLRSICSFFSTSPRRTAVLNEVIKKRFPRAVPTRWNFQSQSVNAVYEYRSELIDCMRTIQTGTGITHSATIIQARGYEEVLQNKKFLFWLSFFYQIMPHLEILFKQMERTLCEPSFVQKQIKAFEHFISNLKVNVVVPNTQESDAKRRKIDDSIETRKQEIKEICDIMIQQGRARFEFKAHLSSAMLFSPHRFSEYHASFPTNYLHAIYKNYKFIDVRKLQTELSAIYEKEELRNITGAVSIFDFIIKNNVHEAFSECVKLLKVLLTIPMTTSEAECSFSTLNRIKAFHRNTMTQDKLSALAMLSVEQDLIKQIPDFNQKVIEKFATRNDRQIDFLFK